MKRIAVILAGVLLSAAATAYSRDPDRDKDAEKVALTAETIREMNAANIVELLNRIPGVEAGDSSVKIRGSYDVKVIMDGRPLNDPLSRHGGIKWSMVSISNIEKIEIFKGSGAVAFGDGTSGGAIRITSRKIGGSKGKLKAEGGNWNTQQYTIDYGRQIDRWGVQLSTDCFSSDNYRLNQDKERMRFGIKTDFQPNEGSVYNFSVDYVNEERGSAGYPAYPTPHAREYAESFTPGLSMTIGRFQNDLHWGVYKQQSVDPDKDVDSSVRGWSLAENLSRTFSSGIFKNFSAGFAFKADYVGGSSIATHHEESYGASVQREFSIGSTGISGVVGLRANFYSSFDPVLNPELKLGYAPARSVDFQLSVTRTNNLPPILKRYYETSTTRANPNLGMENATNLSLSASYHPSKSFQAGMTLFMNEIDDRITYVRDQKGGGGVYRNFGRVTRRGVDLTMEWKPREWLIVKPSHEFLVSTDQETGLKISASPQHRTQVSVHFKPVRQFTAVAVFEHESKQYTRSDNMEWADPYSLLELRADYSIGRWTVYGRVKNVADKTYLYGDGLPAPPRSWIGGMSMEF